MNAAATVDLGLIRLSAARAELAAAAQAAERAYLGQLAGPGPATAESAAQRKLSQAGDLFMARRQTQMAQAVLSASGVSASRALDVRV